MKSGLSGLLSAGRGMQNGGGFQDARRDAARVCCQPRVTPCTRSWGQFTGGHDLALGIVRHSEGARGSHSCLSPVHGLIGSGAALSPIRRESLHQAPPWGRVCPKRRLIRQVGRTDERVRLQCGRQSTPPPGFLYRGADSTCAKPAPALRPLTRVLRPSTAHGASVL